MKRSCLTLSVLCAVLACADCAWAGTLSAVYTYDGAEVTKDTSEFFQIEAKREVQFIYKPGSFETDPTYSITFTDGSSGTMTFSEGNYVCPHTFSQTGEVGISMNAPGFKPVSADVTEAMPFELANPKMSMKPNETNRFVTFNGDANIFNYDVDPVVKPASMAQAAYQSMFNPPRVTVTANSTEGTATLTVTFTHRTSGVSFSRVCHITIDEASTESNMSGGGSGGGCSAGFVGLGLLALLPVLTRRKTK